MLCTTSPSNLTNIGEELSFCPFDASCRTNIWFYFAGKLEPFLLQKNDNFGAIVCNASVVSRHAIQILHILLTLILYFMVFAWSIEITTLQRRSHGVSMS